MYLEKLTNEQKNQLEIGLSKNFYEGKKVNLFMMSNGLFNIFVNNKYDGTIDDLLIPSYNKEKNVYYVTFMTKIFGKEYAEEVRENILGRLRDVTNIMAKDYKKHYRIKLDKLKDVEYHSQLLDALEEKFKSIFFKNKQETATM